MKLYLFGHVLTITWNPEREGAFTGETISLDYRGRLTDFQAWLPPEDGPALARWIKLVKRYQEKYPVNGGTRKIEHIKALRDLAKERGWYVGLVDAKYWVEKHIFNS